VAESLGRTEAETGQLPLDQDAARDELPSVCYLICSAGVGIDDTESSTHAGISFSRFLFYKRISETGN